jgi:hypothetical protein
VHGSVFRHVPHPRTTAILDGSAGPPKVLDQLPLKDPNVIVRFNARAALLVTRAVGTMWCAYAFALFDLLSLPAAIKGGTAAIVSWVAQTFLQLVLLSVILVGQAVQAQAADKRSEQTYADAEAVLSECLQIQAHLEAQDAILTKLTAG